jgi:hypothetical protein
LSLFGVSALALVLFLGLSAQESVEGSTRLPPPHIGDWCAKDPSYSKTTLKPLVDAPVASLLPSHHLKGQRKFEASDVLVKDGYFYAICDSSWAILKVKQSMPRLSEDNIQIGDPEDSAGSPESGFEGIFEDRLTGTVKRYRSG